MVMQAETPDTETQPTTPVVTDAQATPPSAEAKDPPPQAPPETDWKAKYEASERQRVSAEAAARAEAGRARKAQEAADREAAQAAQVKAEWDAFLEGKITDKNSAEAFRKTTQTTAWEKAREVGLKAESQRVLKAADELGLTPNEDDAFNEALDFLAEAKEALTPAQYNRAMNQSRRSADAAIARHRERAEAAKAPPPPPEKPQGPSAEDIARTRALTGIQAGSVGTAMTDEARWAAYGRGDIGWSKEVRDAGKRLGFAE